MSKLRRLLAKLDIHIVVQDDGDGPNDEEGLVPDDEIRQTKDQGTESARRSRRASFNDTKLDESWVSGGRLKTAQSGHSPHASLDELSRMQRQQPVYAPFETNGASSRGRVAVQQQPQARRSRSLSTQDSGRAMRQPAPQPWIRQGSAFYEQDDALEDSESDIPSSPPVLHLQHHADIRAQELEADLAYEADAFLYTSQIKAARQCLHRLHQQSTRIHDLTRVAQNHDQRLLQAQAFNIWATKLFVKRQAAETEHFFEQYERRATRARDLFLLNKAFTHWAQCTSDEVARTSVAKRHILRTRYFNAWRDITAVNEIKCRRLGLRKWFSVWRANTARKAINSERAIAIYEENLVQRTWWKWFWGFCERKAPIWHDHHVRSNCMHRLAAVVARLRQHEAAAVRMRNTNLLRKTFEILTARRNAVEFMSQTAIDKHRTNLMGNCFHQLVQQSKLGLASRQLSTTVSKRLLTTAVSVWQHNTQLAQQAAAADRRRLLQKAWRDWNDNLRASALATKIGDRVVLESLYKWTLQSRLSLFRRVTDAKLQERALQTLSLRLSEKRFHLEEASLIFKEHQRRRMMASVMLRFHGISRAEEMMERQALEFRNAHAINAVMPIWTQKAQHLQKLNRWSKDARFYCLATMVIKKWREVTTQTQRNKRRDAYIQIRRRVKLRLATTSLEAWKGRAAIVKRLNDIADERNNTRLLNAQITLFDIWRFKNAETTTLSLQASDFSARVLFLRTVSVLATKGQEILTQHTQALAFRSQTISVTAAETLKKFKWALFCQKRSLDSAKALRERNERQHQRNMLRFWAEQAVRRRGVKTLPMPMFDGDGETQGALESSVKSASQVRGPVLPPTSNLFSSLRLPSARKIPTQSQTPFSAARASTRLSPLVDGDEGISDVDVEDGDQEMDFGATHRAEEWTNFDVLGVGGVLGRQPPLSALSPPSSQPFRPQQGLGLPQQQQQQQQSNLTTTPLPGYMTRTPSKRSQRARARGEAVSAVGASTGFTRPASARPTRAVLVSTTPAPKSAVTSGLRRPAEQTPKVTPFERKMRKGGYAGIGGSGQRDQRQGEEAVESFTPATFRRTRFGGSIVGPENGGHLQTGRSVRFFDVEEEDDGGGEEV